MLFPDLAFGWAYYCVLMAYLIASSIIDFRSLRIPKALTVSCLALGILFNLGRGMWLGIQDKEVWALQAGPVLGALDGLLFSIAVFAAAFAIFFGLWFLKAAGGGDVKLFAAVGACVGPGVAVAVLAGTVVFVLVVSMARVVWRLITGGMSTVREPLEALKNKKLSAKTRDPKKRLLSYSLPLALSVLVVLPWVFRVDMNLAAPKQSGELRAQSHVR